MLTNMRIGPRLITAFLALAAVAAIVGGVGLWGAQKIDSKANALYSQELLGLSYIKEANIALIAVGRARANFLLASTEAEREKHRASMQRFSDLAHENVLKAQPLFVSDRAKQIFVAYDKLWSAYQAEMTRAIELASKQSLHAQDPALTASLNLVRDHADSLDGMMSELTEQKESRAKVALEETAAVYANSRNWIIAALLIGVAFGIGMAIVISRGVTRPLSVAVVAANRLAKGDFAVSVDSEAKDEAQAEKAEAGGDDAVAEGHEEASES